MANRRLIVLSEEERRAMLWIRDEFVGPWASTFGQHRKYRPEGPFEEDEIEAFDAMDRLQKAAIDVLRISRGGRAYPKAGKSSRELQRSPETGERVSG